MDPEPHTVAGPMILAGVAGTAMRFTCKVSAAVLLQALLAVTLTLPPVVPNVATMLLVVDVPVQPLGSVQV